MDCIKRILSEEKGSSLIVAALLLLAILTVAYSSYLSTTLPQTLEKEEGEYMKGVREKIVEIQTEIQNMEEGEVSRISIPMSTNLSTSTFQGPSIASSMEVIGGKETGARVVSLENSEYIDPSNTSLGSVWMAPDNATVGVSSLYSDELHVNASNENIGSYQFLIEYNDNVVDIDNSRGNKGVGDPTGTIQGVNLGDDNVLFGGFSSSGISGSSDVHIATFYWESKAAGTSPIDVTVNVFTNTIGENIGTPQGLDGERVVDNSLDNADDSVSVNGVFKNQGSLTFQRLSAFYSNQKYVYEYGGVVLSQEGKSVLVSEPSLLRVNRISNDKVWLSIQDFYVLGSSEKLVSTDSVSVLMIKDNVFQVEKALDNLTIKIHSENPQAWRGYLEKKKNELSNMGLDVYMDLSNLLLRINGVEGSSQSKSDVVCTKNYQNIKVSIS